MRVGQKPHHRVELDDIDRSIVAALQEDGRRSAAEIARSVGTSTQTITNRMDRLIQNAVIDVMAILNPPSVGYEKDAIICLRVRQGFLKSVGDRLAEIDCVSYVGFLSGGWDIMIEVYVEDDAQLFHFLSEELAKIEEITATETWTVLRTRKYNYAWSNPIPVSGRAPAQTRNRRTSPPEGRPGARRNRRSRNA